MFLPERYFASKPFSAVREAFRNAYPDREIQNKTTLMSPVSLQILFFLISLIDVLMAVGDCYNWFDSKGKILPPVNTTPQYGGVELQLQVFSTRWR
jgi:hypothetical protein